MTKNHLDLLTSMPHWSHACWNWLHGTQNIRPDVISSLSNILPCMICRIHMKVYISKNPISEPTDKWLHTFHNSVNIQTEKPTFPFEDIDCSKIDNIGSLVRFLFACSFVLDTDKDRDNFIVFFEKACDSVSINVSDKLQWKDRPLSHTIFQFFTYNGYCTQSFDSILEDYVPTKLHPKFKQEVDQNTSRSIVKNEVNDNDIYQKNNTIWIFYTVITLITVLLILFVYFIYYKRRTINII